MLTDAYHAQDGMVDDESYCARVESLTEQLDDMQDDLEKETAKREESEARLEQLLQAAEETPDAVQSRLTEAIARQADHDVRDRPLQGPRRAREGDRYAIRQGSLRGQRAPLNAANYRMASWSTDKKAVETADHYRIKYEEAMKELGDLKGTYRKAINLAYADAARSKVKREAIRAVESGVEALLRLR